MEQPKPNIDPKPIIAKAIEYLEAELQTEDKGIRGKILTAIQILANFQPTSWPGAPSDPAEQAVLDAWCSCVEPFVAEHTRPFRLHKKGLVVFVENEGWVREIGRNINGILAKCQASVGFDTVKRIHLRVDSWHQELRLLYSLPAHIFSPSWRKSYSQGVAPPSVFELVNEAFEKATEGSQIRPNVEFDKLPDSNSPRTPTESIPEPREPKNLARNPRPEESSIFQEFRVDLERILELARKDLELEGGDPISALARASRGVAARRWAQGKKAEDNGHMNEASEQKAHAGFWYRAADGLVEMPPDRAKS